MKSQKKTSNGIVDFQFAQKIVEKNARKKGGKTEIFNGLTTTKLRGLLSNVNRLYTIVFNTTSDELSNEFVNELEYLKIKFYYEASRENAVKIFLSEAKIIEKLDMVIQDRSKTAFLDYCKYFEALVAYAKFNRMGD
ncbi:type III-A CRISPR-associated protein Csm2 [Staphylococcus rostri]|uniref:CRISPR system Cms protein Csm2 n=1 Tax=Staphylococcus rostri TaxID=522262 RepID=A0A2K3YKP3_9STAP|nr:type III-A CRISPR-associated protein Csm2 [Staphylococcus rostri]PNZ25818.1 type III-A CRISPR-associated protein Csm2 [Staphylococcus rostri]